MNTKKGSPNCAEFKKELEVLINKHSMENASNTPDYILAEYLIQSLMAFDLAVAIRDGFYLKQ